MYIKMLFKTQKSDIQNSKDMVAIHLKYFPLKQYWVKFYYILQYMQYWFATKI